MDPGCNPNKSLRVTFSIFVSKRFDGSSCLRASSIWLCHIEGSGGRTSARAYQQKGLKPEPEEAEILSLRSGATAEMKSSRRVTSPGLQVDLSSSSSCSSANFRYYKSNQLLLFHMDSLKLTTSSLSMGCSFSEKIVGDFEGWLADEGFAGGFAGA
jgi:hypothetical protein